MLTILQLKQLWGQKLAPKDNGRQEKDFISKERKEISLGTTSAVKERMEERYSSQTPSLPFTEPLLFY